MVGLSHDDLAEQDGVHGHELVVLVPVSVFHNERVVPADWSERTAKP